jgi:hypothetical protein
MGSGVKRITWLLLIAFSAVMAQVQPVDVHVSLVKKCSCCEQPGDCGMPDCGLPPVASQRALPVAEASSTLRAAERVAPQAHKAEVRLFAQALARASLTPTRLTPAVPARVPLFKEHCSFLI